MPFITGEHGGRAAIVRIAVIDAGRYHAHRQAQDPAVRGVRTYEGLIDTGATTTMVTRRVVIDAGLTAIGSMKVRGLGGDVWKNVVLFHVAFTDGMLQLDDPASDQGAPVDRLQVLRTPIEGGELTEATGFDVLIGMDVITTGTLTISAEGTFSFAF